MTFPIPSDSVGLNTDPFTILTTKQWMLSAGLGMKYEAPVMLVIISSSAHHLSFTALILFLVGNRNDVPALNTPISM